MDLIVENLHSARWGEDIFPCALGRNGILDANLKREGDGKTPIGRWPIREIFYRKDRLEKPETVFPIRPLTPDDAWCDNPNDLDYNRLVRYTPEKGVEKMWRDDHLYDIVVVLGHNDDPVRPHMGSAIFLHLARPDYSPSAGCVTLSLPHLLKVLKEATLKSGIDIKPTP